MLHNVHSIAVLLLLVVMCGTANFSSATSYSASSSGNWDNSSTWSVGRVPADYDTITVPSGKTVTVNIVTQEYVNMKIIVDGTLHFNGGKKIRMCDGIVVVNSGGLLEADNNGSKIDICSNIAWDGSSGGSGPLTITNPNPLPITVLSFSTTEISDNSVTLTWASASEYNCLYYLVERSRDADSFEPVTEIAARRNGSQIKTYSCTDKNPFNGISYYRLSSVNKNGDARTIKVISVFRKLNAEVKIFPNPVKANTSVTIEADIRESCDKISIDIYSQDGNLLFSEQESINSDGKKVRIKLFRFQSPGIYFLKIQSGDFTSYKQIAVTD